MIIYFLFNYCKKYILYVIDSNIIFYHLYTAIIFHLFFYIQIHNHHSCIFFAHSYILPIVTIFYHDTYTSFYT